MLRSVVVPTYVEHMSVRVLAPTVEHHREPFGIGERTPRLSWIVEEAPAGWHQTAYEIDVADRCVRVESAESVLVPWPFEPLESRDTVRVRVRVYGGDSVSDWSEPTTVEVGLSATDWQAVFVAPDAIPYRTALLRSEFTLADKEIAAARYYGSALGLYEAEINGVRVGIDELAPGWTVYDARLRYQTYDVTDLLRPGGNAIGVLLANGWFRGRLGWEGGISNIYGTELAVLAQLEVRYADGSREVFGSSPEWKSGTSPVVDAELYDGETYDARLEQPGWSSPGFDDSAWKPTHLVERDLTTLVAPDGPPMRHTETVPVAEVLTTPSGRTVLDFGQNLVGRLRIAISGPAGHAITLRHAEVMEDGELAVGPLRSAKATDTYTLRGDSVEEWAPRFTFHGFRYAEVLNWPGDVDPSAVTAEVIHSDLERTGHFECSDERVNRLHDNVVWSMRGNFLDVPTDCPQRDERLGWTGDLQVFAPTAAFLYDVSGFLVSWLADLAVEQEKAGGVVPIVIPNVRPEGATPRTAWSDAATIVPWVIFQRFGDIDVLSRQFDSMTAWVDCVDRLAGPGHLWDTGFQYGDWLDPMAPADHPAAALTASAIVATAYFARSAQIVADTAQLLGRSADAERYGKLAAAVRAAFADQYVTPAGRLMSDATTAYSLALEFALLPSAGQRERAALRLAELVRDNEYRASTGFVGAPLICDALSANDHAAEAYRMLLTDEPPSWLYPLTQGATTIWERWDSLRPDGRINTNGMTSFNHYAFGAIADWLHRVVAGLTPTAPGYRTFRVAPRPGPGIDRAAATFRSPYGVASSEWSVEGDTFSLRVRVPVGATAHVVLPSGETVTDVPHGTHSWTESLPSPA